MAATCPDRGYLVGLDHELPDDPTDLDVENLPTVGCNRLWCHACRELVLSERTTKGRSYRCSCSRRLETGVQALDDADPEAFRSSPDVPWRCDGHPPIELPHDIDGGRVTSHAELRVLAVRAFHGEYPPRARAADAARGDWLRRLRARLAPGAASIVADAALACLSDPDTRTRARALRFFFDIHDPSAHARVLELLPELAGLPDEVNGTTSLEETAWRVLEAGIGSSEQVRDRARAAALGGHGSRALFSALAEGDTAWFLAHGREMARATPERSEDLFASFAQVPDDFVITGTQVSDARDRVRETIAGLITLDEALERTLYPVAAWDHSFYYGPYLWIVKPAAWGAMRMKGAKVDASQREPWNERVRARDGRVGATHLHSQLAWVFEDDHCGIWNKTRELCRGDLREIRMPGGSVVPAEVTKVMSFFEKAGAVHRGVRCEVSGRTVLVHEEHDPDPPTSDENPDELVDLQSAWAFYLGRDLATWLGVPHLDHDNRETNTRHLEVRRIMCAFADRLASADAPATCTLGTFDNETLSLAFAAEGEQCNLTLHIAPRVRAQQFTMKRGSLAQITRYLRHFLTPERMLGAAHGDF